MISRHEVAQRSLRRLTVVAYTKRNRYVGRIEINAAALTPDEIKIVEESSAPKTSVT